MQQPPIDAQAAVRNACTNPDASNSYDIGVLAQGPGVTFDYTIEVSGQNYHLYGTAEHSEYTGEFEIIEVDGVIYYREAGIAWEIVEGVPSGAFISHLAQLCPQGEVLSTATRSGSESIRGVDTTLYTITEKFKRGPDSQRTFADTHTLWVDTSGQLVKSRLVMESPVGTGQVDGTVSGYGEPNVVTARTVP